MRIALSMLIDRALSSSNPEPQPLLREEDCAIWREEIPIVSSLYSLRSRRHAPERERPPGIPDFPGFMTTKTLHAARRKIDFDAYAWFSLH